MWKDQKKNEKKIMMEIEISFGKGRSDHVPVYYGDDPYDLAQTFVNRHGLKAASISTIGSYLESTIQEFCANNPDARDMSDSFDSSQLDFDYDNVQTRFHNPIVEPPEPSQIAKKEEKERNQFTAHSTETVGVGKTAEIKFMDRKVQSEKYSSSQTPPLRTQNSYDHDRVHSNNSTPLKNEWSPAHRFDRALTPEKKPVTPSQIVLNNLSKQRDSRPNSPARGEGGGIAAMHTPEYYLSHDEFDEQPVDKPNWLASNSTGSAKFYQSATPVAHLSNLKVRSSSPSTTKPSNKLSTSLNSAPAVDVSAIAMHYNAADLALLDSLSAGDIDHRQFQENLDRNVNSNLQSFSYKKIATELVASASSKSQLGHQSVSSAADPRGSLSDSHHSVDQSAASLRHYSEPPTRLHNPSPPHQSNRHYSEAPGLRPDSIHNTSSHTIGSHNTSNSATKAPSVSKQFADLYTGSNKQRSQMDLGPVPVLRVESDEVHSVGTFASQRSQSHRSANQQQRLSASHSPLQFESSGVDDFTDRTRSRQNTAQPDLLSRHAVADTRYSDEKREYGSDMDDEASLENQHQRAFEDAAAAQQLSEEETYNRMRQKTNQYISQVKTSLTANAKHRQHSAYGSNVSHTQVPLLQPKRNSLEMGNNKSLNSQDSWMHREKNVLVGKSANERLYLTANIVKEKQHYREQVAAKHFQQSIEEGRFKLNNASRKIVEKMSVRGYQGPDGDNHIGLRLHAEGVKEKAMRTKRAENMKNVVQSEEWSCARCGTYHKISSANIVIQPLHQVNGQRNGHNNAGQLQNRVVKVCSKCGWDQGAVQEFTPINIGLALLDDPQSVAYERRTEYGIHDYLYHNAEERDKLLLVNKAVHEESDNNASSFQPRIPASSQEIVKKYRQSADRQNGGGNSVFSLSDAGSATTEQLNKQQKQHNMHGSAVLSGPQLGEYLSIPLVERLAHTQVRQVDENHTLYKSAANKKSSDAQSRAEKRPVLSTKDPLPQKADQFVNRLVYEYRDKEVKVAKAAALQQFDPLTHQPLFQPVVQPLPGDLYNVNVESSGGKKDVFDDILERDELLKQKKLRAQQEAQEKESRELQTQQIKALDHSESILRAATERNIEELFQILLGTRAAGDSQSGGTTPGGKSDWRENGVLDLLWVSGDLVIEEVGQLLQDMRSDRLTELQNQSFQSFQSEHNSLPVTFTEFRQLALKCLRKREGLGKAYVFAPKKKPELAVAMAKQVQRAETFTPAIDKLSAELCSSRTKMLQEKPIELILQAEGDRTREKVESARHEQILRESEELTFKPRLFKPPSYVQPKYRGLDKLLSDESLLSEMSLMDQSCEERKSTAEHHHTVLSAHPPPPPLPAQQSQAHSLSYHDDHSENHHFSPTQNSGLHHRAESRVQMEPHHHHPLLRLRSDSSLTCSTHSSQSSLDKPAPPKRKPTSHSYNGAVRKPSISGSVVSGSVASGRSSKIAQKTTSKDSGASQKSSKPPLPLLPHEMLALRSNNKAQNLPSAAVDDTGSVGGSVGGPSAAGTLKGAKQGRLSVESDLTHSTSSTVVKKRG